MRTLVPITFASSKTVTPAASARLANVVAKVVGRRGCLHVSGLDGGRPLALAKVVEVERPTARRGEEQRCVESRRERIEPLQGTARERHLATAAGGLYIATHRGLQLGIGLASQAVRHYGGAHG